MVRVNISRSEEVKGVFGLKKLQNHSTVQVQGDYFPKYIYRETIPQHAVLTVIQSPRLFPSPQPIQSTVGRQFFS